MTEHDNLKRSLRTKLSETKAHGVSIRKLIGVCQVSVGCPTGCGYPLTSLFTCGRCVGLGGTYGGTYGSFGTGRGVEVRSTKTAYQEA